MTAARKLMDADEFFAWAEEREEVWELVDGVPVMKRPEAMSFTTQRHNRIVTNLLIALSSRLAGRCSVWTESIGARVTASRVRRPDVMIDCGPANPSGREASAPTALFEVLSGSTRNTDLQRKTFEYRSLPTAMHFVVLEQEIAVCTHWRRGEDGAWRDELIDGLDGVLTLQALGISVPLTEVYAGVELDERP